MGAGNGETPKPTQISISKDQFLAWKRQKDAELLAKQAEAARKRQEDIASGNRDHSTLISTATCI
ncbi:hypothetical protein AtNW77_Chr1g0024901 [Arabidopsis thaliana]|uniref:Zinc finger CCCH domain protein n=1 Tax=Arabidopsis thaliana TaxID=3702 RepID=A8MR19_ARATH|nr:zinc finger CCCH domain protein [Arabidopsis thaliana]AEE30202.1 zinc finger CCCH domain protein [Arabidopsis thaliana]|eukprot:NP_973881.2 zinc finger CCCH domain protein [Arabidopsis thaliana]